VRVMLVRAGAVGAVVHRSPPVTASAWCWAGGSGARWRGFDHLDDLGIGPERVRGLKAVDMASTSASISLRSTRIARTQGSWCPAIRPLLIMLLTVRSVIP